MKVIYLPIRNSVSIPPNTAVNLTASLENIKEAQKKGDGICRSAVSLEALMEDLLNFYFKPQHEKQQNLLASAVFGSSSFSFSDKRRLLLLITKEESFIGGKSYSEFEHCSKKVISLRNAFTHGNLSSDGSVVTLSYFEGTKREVILDDEYLTKIENYFGRAWYYVDELSYYFGFLVRPKT